MVLPTLNPDFMIVCLRIEIFVSIKVNTFILDLFLENLIGNGGITNLGLDPLIVV